MNPVWSQNPSSSQSTSQPPVFVDENGHALHIFIQVELEGRPRLIRSIRAAGATISSNPENARIFLVDPESTEGQHVIADWGSAGGHAVLHLDWVRECLDRGFAMLARDNWGGHRLFGEDGPPANDEVTNATQKSPLPTPRQTPVSNTPPIGSIHPPLIQGIPIPQSTPFQFGTNGNIPMSQPSTPMVPQFIPNAFPPVNPQVNIQVPANLAQTVMDMISRNMMPNMVPQVPQQFPLGFPSNHNYFPPPPLPQQFADPVRSRSASYTTADYPDSRAITPSQSLPVNGSQPTDTVERARKRVRYSEPSRSASVASDRAGKKKSRRARLFTDAHGEALGFVVQVDLRNRMEVVQNIKSHGGAIRADIQDADYVVLAHQSTTFMNLYVTANALNKPSVQPAFIHDCVDQGKILDPDLYAFETVPQKPKRGRPALHANPPVKTPKKEKMEVKPKPTPSPSKKASSSKKVKQSTSPRKGNRTPSPAPPTKAVAFAGGKNRFTEPELAYCLSYAAILYKRDPGISWNAVVGKIAAKMPQHSRASWLQTLSKNRGPYEELQKKAAIQYRKMQAQKQAQDFAEEQSQGQASDEMVQSSVNTPAQSETPSPPVPQSHERSGSPPPPPPSTTPPDFESDEFRAIIQSLADGLADDKSDEDVWIAMSHEHPYHTARGWRDYWDMYSEWIQPEVERRMR
ncbi:hypothetical protein QCA50_001932 [Cerrena zonata]|uniref:BRCT domain-containing protein n=1 Tax=Cerrena zonata TaxID=2478898 RepID=A0AAW0GUH4_9APHY